MQKALSTFSTIIICFLGFLALSQQDVQAQSTTNAHSFSFVDIDGKEINLADFKGKVVMIVNTASQCKFTPQYAQLEELYERFSEQGLVIIAIPSNDFGQQEPGSNQQIKDFVDKKYQVTFLVADKTHVSGKDAHPFYKWAETQVTYLGTPMWNFHKYIIDKKGNLEYWFTSTTEPTSTDVVKAIEMLLKSK
jgi:glutathione peroxidase